MIRMFEKELVALAEVVQPRFSIGRCDKAILRTLSVADMQKLALSANPRERVPFVLPEFTLFIRSHKLDHGAFQDISEKVIRLHKMIAGIEITVMLRCHPFAWVGRL